MKLSCSPASTLPFACRPAIHDPTNLEPNLPVLTFHSSSATFFCIQNFLHDVYYVFMTSLLGGIIPTNHPLTPPVSLLFAFAGPLYADSFDFDFE